jgi:type IV pilus assembly protein PilB
VCRNTGFKGRVGLFEVIRITPKLRDMIAEGIPLPDLRKEAQKHGMMLLADAGLEKVREGVTSLEEALSVSMAESEEET